MTLAEARWRFPPFWTIYDHPLDYPHHYVVRVWYGDIPDPTAQLAGSLVGARRLVFLAGGSFCLGRDRNDDPFIVESWI